MAFAANGVPVAIHGGTDCRFRSSDFVSDVSVGHSLPQVWLADIGDSLQIGQNVTSRNRPPWGKSIKTELSPNAEM